MVLSDKFYEVVAHEGVVSIVSWNGKDAPHITNTWNSYLVIKDDERILIPAAGLTSTKADVEHNDQVLVTLGAREVEGFNGYQGTGFKLEGTAKFYAEGADFEETKEKYPFAREVLVIRPSSAKQLL